MSKRQIFTMGGGGFLEEPENPLLDRFFINLCGKPKPKVAFVGTASGDAVSAHEKFFKAMAQHHNVEATLLSLFKPPVGSLREFVLAQDVIYVGGGNTRNLMVLWKEWGLDQILREAYNSGVVMGGISAGSICWFEEGVTDSVTGTLSKLNCTGFLPGSNCPHFDGEVERRPAYHRLLKAGMKPGLACDNSVAGYFVNEKLVECVSSVRGRKAYKLSLVDGEVIEQAIEPRFLG